MGETKQVQKALIEKTQVELYKKEILYHKFRMEIHNKYSEWKKGIFEKEWIRCLKSNGEWFYNTQTELLIPVLPGYKYGTERESYGGLRCCNISEEAAVLMFGNEKKIPKGIRKGIENTSSRTYVNNCLMNAENYFTIKFSDAYYGGTQNIYIPFCSVAVEEFQKSVEDGSFEISGEKNFTELLGEFRKLGIRSALEIQDDVVIDQWIDKLSIDREGIKKEIEDRFEDKIILSKDEEDSYIENLLNCDYFRADLEPYDRKCLDDVNAGHWELWFDEDPEEKDGEKIIGLTDSLTARNPVCDVCKNGLIGIDFGTKSTIVSMQDGKEKISLLRIGIGQLNEDVETFHYENPTVMEFIDLDKFIDDYGSRKGRPHTSIQDVTVSHKASNNMNECGNTDFFYSYFYDIKQWCGDSDYNVKIRDQQGHEYLLGSFVDLKEDELNPLELYAYYLGLYINNMRNKIFIDYVVSFPVNYEKSVKEKIVESFKKGLMKSLPEAVLDNEDIMSKFRVRQGVSEPAAYAITALKEYGFDPEEDEKILYSVFDFGGGTTDFDFGLIRCADEDCREEERYDYVIEQFGSEGDRYLGGENLLALLAYEVFKANASKLKANESSAGFSFTKPKECDPFPGSEMLIADSQEARRNTKEMIEKLRPFWEGIIATEEETDTEEDILAEADEVESEDSFDEDEEEENAAATEESNDDVPQDSETDTTYDGYRFSGGLEIIRDQKITLDLYDKNGEKQPAQTLDIKSVNDGIDVPLIDILEKRIKKGVENFISSVEASLERKGLQEEKKMNVFFAGNSSKSPILKKVFEEVLEKKKQQESSGIKNKEFELYPPLGTLEAIEIQKARGIKIDEKDIEMPTGKTGVAYGLILGRDSGTEFKVIPETDPASQTKFKYNIGRRGKKGKFKVMIDRNTIGYNEWVRFINAGEPDFEIYYTSLPDARNMCVGDDGVKLIKCQIDNIDIDQDVFIRVIAPDQLEYVVSDEEHIKEIGDKKITGIILEE